MAKFLEEGAAVVVDGRWPFVIYLQIIISAI